MMAFCFVLMDGLEVDEVNGQCKILWPRSQQRNTMSGGASSIPSWLLEHCERLTVSDPSLTNLCLNVRRLDEAMSHELSQALLQNSTLLTLNTTSAFASNPSAFHLFAKQGLVDQKSLQVLHLSYNRLEIVSELGRVLASDTTLQSLHLDHNLIEFTSVIALTKGLAKNASLTALHLNSNRISDQGCLALADALRSNTTLQRLDLSSNQLTVIGAEALLNTLENHNYTLTWVNLEQNGLSLALLSRINVICRANQAGRKALLTGTLLPCLWARLLHGKDRDLVWYLLRSKPDFATFLTKGRKRSHEDVMAEEQFENVVI
jgi:hypothetical protein